MDGKLKRREKYSFQSKNIRIRALVDGDHDFLSVYNVTLTYACSIFPFLCLIYCFCPRR